MFISGCLHYEYSGITPGEPASLLGPLGLFCCLVSILSLSSEAYGQVSKMLYPWHVVEITVHAAKVDENPYARISVGGGDDPVSAVFTGTGGEADGLRFTIVGFWDGGATWKIRFAPPASGRWTYETRSADTGLNGKKGSFEVSSGEKKEGISRPAGHGFVRVHTSGPRSGRYFEYADGTPFLWIGDTWWNWTKRDIRFESFRRLVDDRARKGFTVGQLFVAGNGWGRESSLLDESASVLDLELMQRVDSMVSYANARGITVWVQAWWSRERLDQTVGPEKIKRWWRYLIHRLGAYNVIWVLAGEYNMYDYGGLGLEFWKDLGKMIDREDPYDRIISAHNTPPAWDAGDLAPQWSTGSVLHEEPWLRFNQSQVGHGRWRNEMIPSVVAADYARVPSKPIVVTEPWYEFARGSAGELDVRFAVWSSILSGAAGHTYGGGHVWLAHLPESPAGGGPWPFDSTFTVNTLDYPGAKSMEYAARFFEHVEWWRLEPHPEVVLEYPSPFCSAIPGQEYVVYLRYGGSPVIELIPSSVDDRFAYQWYEPGTGKFSKEGVVQGGGKTRFQAPIDYPGCMECQDWVLYLKRVSD